MADENKTEEELQRILDDTIKLFRMEWEFLLEFKGDLYIPVPPEIEKFSTTLMEDKYFFPNKIIYLKNLTNVQFGYSPDNLRCEYTSKEISVIIHTFDSLKNFAKKFPTYTDQQLSQKNSPERNRLMRYILSDLKEILNDKCKKDDKTYLLLMSDIINPVANFLGFDCLMNLCDYMFNDSSWVPCIYEQVKYNTRLFVIEKLDKTVPNLIEMFKNCPLKSESDIKEKLLPVLKKIPEHWCKPFFWKYACQMLVDPVISPEESQFSDSCGIPYICSTLNGGRVLVDKLWLNPYEYHEKFNKVNTIMSPDVVKNSSMSEYRYTTEDEDQNTIDLLEL